MPFFSVVVPVYNKKPHLKRAVISVLGQIFTDFELILVDDASTDKSLEEIEKFSDARIRIFKRNQPGPGGYAARNLGIEKSIGQWIAFLDADDEWYPDHLQRMHQLSIEYPDVCLMGCSFEMRAGATVTVEEYYRVNKQQKNHTLSVVEYIDNRMHSRTPMWTSIVCVKKTSPVADGLFPAELLVRRGGDLHAWLKLICYHKKMAWSHHIGAIYYRDSVNMVTRSAPWSPLLMSKAVYEELSVRLNDTEKRFLKRYLNYELGNAWKGNYNTNNGTFSLWDKLYWRGDYYRAMYLFLLSITPLGLLDALKGVRKKVLGRP